MHGLNGQWPTGPQPRRTSGPYMSHSSDRIVKASRLPAVGRSQSGGCEGKPVTGGWLLEWDDSVSAESTVAAANVNRVADRSETVGRGHIPSGSPSGKAEGIGGDWR